MRWCKKCVYPQIAIDFSFGKDGICSGCKSKELAKQTNWKKELGELKKLTSKYKNKLSYDCIIPVSGGKDSYFQTYFVTKVLKLNPLLVTYNTHNYLDIGLENLKNMREAFGVDHYFFTPSLKVIKEMNVLGFTLTGDPNWHCHTAIATLPFIIAVKFKVPLIVWGEHALDINGKNLVSDKIEFTKRERDEKDMRGFTIQDFLKNSKILKRKDLQWLEFPNDIELKKNKVRGIYLGNYVKWDGNYNYKIAKKYGFKILKNGFQRTYRKISNLDDRYENGLHDYLKYIKFGYGRATDHASRDIRLGRMSRKKGISMVKKYDHIIPDDLYYWLNYVNFPEKKFWKICDSFRDKRVWKKEKGKWVKENIWDNEKI